MDKDELIKEIENIEAKIAAEEDRIFMIGIQRDPTTSTILRSMQGYADLDEEEITEELDEEEEESNNNLEQLIDKELSLKHLLGLMNNTVEYPIHQGQLNFFDL